MTYPRRPRELTSKDGAKAQIAAIRQYWWSRGWTKVDAWEVRLGNHRKRPVYGVRSNLIDGRPA